MSAYYNEIEAYPSAWIRNLAAAGHISSGTVDERDIRSIRASDLEGFTQAHFFAGIGVWSYALRLAGWPDSLPAWTGSCPCQPFSAAGKRGGFDDERHLWPEWFRLIRECRPPVVFGEQVASPDGLKWFDAVSTDLEGEGYAVGAADLCAAGVGAPHIRQRLFFVAIADRERRDGLDALLRGRGPRQDRAQTSGGGEVGGMADDSSGGRGQGRAVGGRRNRGGDAAEGAGSSGGGGIGWLGHTERRPAERQRLDLAGEAGGAEGEARQQRIRADAGDAGTTGGIAMGDAQLDGPEGKQRAGAEAGAVERSGAVRGFWRDAEWLPCLDGKARPTKPGIFPLVDGVTARVGKLRAAGNAISPQVAATFIRAVIEALRA